MNIVAPLRFVPPHLPSSTCSRTHDHTNTHTCARTNTNKRRVNIVSDTHICRSFHSKSSARDKVENSLLFPQSFFYLSLFRFVQFAFVLLVFRFFSSLNQFFFSFILFRRFFPRCGNFRLVARKPFSLQRYQIKMK